MKFALLVTAAILVPAVGQPQTSSPGRPLSLEAALTIADEKSEQVAIALAGVSRASAEEVRARSEWFPQLSLTASYDRTLATEFEGLFDAPPGGNGADGDGEEGPDFGELPFGRKNIWRVNLQFSQNLFNAGRIAAQQRAARAGAESADIGVASARAQLALDVVSAYYGAVLADRLVAIAEAAYRQAEAAYQQTRLQREAGTQPEFELLRAQVSRDNQRPAVIRRQSDRQLALLRLKQLLEVPADEQLVLTTNLDEPGLPPPAPFAAAVAAAGAASPQPRPTTTGVQPLQERAPIRQAERTVAARNAAIDIARSQRLPSVSVTSSYGRVTYPTGFFPDITDFRTNWTVGAVLQVPLLTGGRLGAEQAIARADAVEAQALLKRTRELAELDTQAAMEELTSAQASWEASSGTVTQAGRAYEIAELRYRQGISTQLELTDARFLLQQAEANRAMAARDVQVARARVALLPDLPLGSATQPSLGTGDATGLGQPRTPQQAPQQSPNMRAAQATGSFPQ